MGGRTTPVPKPTPAKPPAGSSRSSSSKYRPPQILKKMEADAEKALLASGALDWVCHCGNKNYLNRPTCKKDGYTSKGGFQTTCTGTRPSSDTNRWKEHLAIVRRSDPNYHTRF